MSTVATRHIGTPMGRNGTPMGHTGTPMGHTNGTHWDTNGTHQWDTQGHQWDQGDESTRLRVAGWLAGWLAEGGTVGTDWRIWSRDTNQHSAQWPQQRAQSHLRLGIVTLCPEFHLSGQPLSDYDSGFGKFSTNTVSLLSLSLRQLSLDTETTSLT